MMKLTIKPYLSGLVLAALLLGACMDKKIVEERSPFSPNIVRLGDTEVARVEGTVIYLSDIEHAALAKGLIKPGSSLTPSDPLYQRILDELIDQRLLALEALRRSYDQNDVTRRRLSTSRERILSNTVIEALMSDKVTDEAARRIYEQQVSAQGAGEQVRARQIVVATEDEAKEMKELVETGGDFAALARKFSIDQSTADLGGDLGYFALGSLSNGIDQIAFDTTKGKVSEPFETKSGWHILTTIARRQTPRPSFEDMKPEIISFITYDEIDNLLNTLRSNSEISLMSAAQKPAAEQGGAQPITETPTPDNLSEEQ